jgi:hypothetical protein
MLFHSSLDRGPLITQFADATRVLSVDECWLFIRDAETWFLALLVVRPHSRAIEIPQGYSYNRTEVQDSNWSSRIEAIYSSCRTAESHPGYGRNGLSNGSKACTILAQNWKKRVGCATTRFGTAQNSVSMEGQNAYRQSEYILTVQLQTFPKDIYLVAAAGTSISRFIR